MKKVLTIQNPITKETSAVFIGSSIDSMDIILSKPEMNRTLGWINCIHDEILNCEFQVVAPIVKDITHVELKHHGIWRENRKLYDLNSYMIDTLACIRDEVLEQFNESESIESIIGEEEKSIKFINLESHISNGLMLPSLEQVMKEKNVDKLVFRFTATDWIGWETVGYCIYDIETKETKCYISPIEFLVELKHVTYGYAGMIYAHQVMNKRDILNPHAISGISKAVQTRIAQFSDKDGYEKRINEAMKI